MDPPPPTSRSDLLSTYWRDPEYLTYVPLTSHTALDYFSRSVFFDPSSTNEILRMQNIATTAAAPHGVNHKSPREQEAELRRFTGIEFVLVHYESERERDGSSSSAQLQPQAGGRGFQYIAEDTLFLVQKRRRESPTQATVLETYYILNGNVHMAPDLETVLQNRLMNSLHSLRHSLSIARDNQFRPILPPSSSSAQSANASKRKRSGAPEHAQTSSTTTTTATTLGAQATAESQARNEENRNPNQGHGVDAADDDDDEEAALDVVDV